MSNIQIKRVGITEQKERTWGRIHLDYIEGGEEKFFILNWHFFEEKNYVGKGSFLNEASFNWFDSKVVVEDYEDVLDGLHDTLELVQNSKHRSQFGIPSKLLFELVQNLDAGLGEDISNRRGWYKG